MGCATEGDVPPVGSREIPVEAPVEVPVQVPMEVPVQVPGEVPAAPVRTVARPSH